MSQILALQTEDGTHHLPCPPGARLRVGSAEDSDIALNGPDIPASHVLLERIGELRFRVTALSREGCTVNGVSGAQLDVDVPFRFSAGGDVIVFDLASDSGAGAQPVRRRDYLLGPIHLRARAVKPVVPQARSSEPVSSAHAEEPRMISAPPPQPDAAMLAALVPPVVAVKKSAHGTGLGKWAAVFVLCAVVAGAGWKWRDAFLTGFSQSVEDVPPPAPPAAVPVPVQPETEMAATKAPPPTPVPEPPAVPPPDFKAVAAREAAGHVRAFLSSWNEESAAGVLEHVSATASSYFEAPNPASDAVLRMEEDFRSRWPRRVIQTKGEPVVTATSADRAEVLQPFAFELGGQNRVARGSGELRCTVERDEAKKWRITSAADRIDLGELTPSRAAFSPAISLRELKPVLSMEETRQAAMDHLHEVVKAGDAKASLAAILKAAADHPQEAFWRHATDKVCAALSITLFSKGEWDDPACVQDIKALSEAGEASAMLLHGHLLRAGYAMPRNEAQGELLYRKAYETAKSREARFYYAEALFMGGEFEKASAIALATMHASKHPLEAYLAAHLLWKKAEIDPSLWQQVYETVSRVADTHPPARNLAGLVLLKHGQTRKERETGFALIKQAAEAGVVEAMKNLGACYDLGDGCEKNAAEAEKWKTKAATSKPPVRRHHSEFAVAE
ncbi:MAG: hypothetical protein JNG86_23050 [Verrucomicrobiaceae bacterium]|nr:hypothetical protein [Verrucomicrobiaceae bacterium]